MEMVSGCVDRGIEAAGDGAWVFMKLSKNQMFQIASKPLFPLGSSPAFKFVGASPIYGAAAAALLEYIRSE
jgi:hypothetical protein